MCTDKQNGIFHPVFNVAAQRNNPVKELFFLMSVFSQTFFTFVSRHFMTFSFFTAWHLLKNYEL
jgi:hypothetical protein